MIDLHPSRPFILAPADLLERLIDMYLSDVSCSDLTKKGYAYGLSRLISWWRDAGPELGWRLDERSTHDFRIHLCERGLSHNSQSMIMSRCRQLFGWAYRGGYVSVDCRHWFPAPSGRPPLRRAPAPAEIAALLAAAGQSRQPHRDQAIVALFAGTGIRRAELAHLCIEDVTLSADRSGQVAIHHGKGGTCRVALFDRHCGNYLLRYLDHRGESEGRLFAGQRGPLNEKGIHNVVRKAAQRAGLDISCHDLRRAFATYWTRTQRGTGYALPLSMQLGHTDPAMTVHYSRLTVEDVAGVFVSPLREVWTFEV